MVPAVVHLLVSLPLCLVAYFFLLYDANHEVNHRLEAVAVIALLHG